ncbi:MAG: PEP/pyruvate-binding domain-containing protein, partial [Planctomycetota bacterium]
MSHRPSGGRPLPPFQRDLLGSGECLSQIGTGAIGGKARGLALAAEMIAAMPEADHGPGIQVAVPTLAVIATDVFDAFMERNRLYDIAQSDIPDERIAHAFQRADLPTEVLGDLRTLADGLRSPLAVRSSSLLEDALHRPFAGVYETKMTPNNQSDGSARFLRLVEAVKFVYASTYFKAAKDYVRATGEAAREEKMAVIVQQMVGQRHDVRFYPEVSGVGRSFNFYPVSGRRREDGVVVLALGLGKTVVDGGLSYSYSPARPKAPPPFGSVRDVLVNTQREYWAVNVGKPPPYDPVAETEYLVRATLEDAEYDDTLRHVASTYVAASDRIS